MQFLRDNVMIWRVSFYVRGYEMAEECSDDVDAKVAKGKKNWVFPIIVTDPGHTKLRLSREGLEAIEKIIAPITADHTKLRLSRDIIGSEGNPAAHPLIMTRSRKKTHAQISQVILEYKKTLYC